MRDPSQSRPEPKPSPASRSVSWEHAVFVGLHAALDPVEFARALAAAAVHSCGLEAGAAHVLVREPLTDVFERTARFAPPEEAIGLADWMEAARVHGPQALASSPAPAPAAWDFEALDPTTRQSWRDGRAAIGEAAGHAVPWALAARHAVIPLRIGGIEHGVVVAELHRSDAAGFHRL